MGQAQALPGRARDEAPALAALTAQSWPAPVLTASLSTAAAQDEEDEEDARQLRAVAGGTPLYQVAAPAVVAAATTGIKRRVRATLEGVGWEARGLAGGGAVPAALAARPPLHACRAVLPRPRRLPAARRGRVAAARSGRSTCGVWRRQPGAGKRNVVRINLRQQTIRPNYVEEPDEDAGQPQRLPLQQAQAAALQQMLQQPGAAAAAPAAAQWQAVPPPPASAVVQQPAVPDWAAHLPPAPQSFQPAHPPWMRKVASGGALAQQSKQSSGSAAWGGAKAAQFNRSTTPGFYAGGLPGSGLPGLTAGAGLPGLGANCPPAGQHPRNPPLPRPAPPRPALPPAPESDEEDEQDSKGEAGAQGAARAAAGG